MKVRCVSSGLWNQTIDVGGTVYNVDSAGFVEVSDSHGEILLRGQHWALVQKSEPTKSDGTAPVADSVLDRKVLEAKSGAEITKLARSKGLSVINKTKASLIDEILDKVEQQVGESAPAKE